MTKDGIVLFSSNSKGAKRDWKKRETSSSFNGIFLGERVFLLSRNTGDPTVGGLRAEKERRSTQSRLRVDSGFASFRQTPRGRDFSLLGFIPSFKRFTNV